MYYVISDIHGNKNKFNSILKQINLKQDDVLYILGDVIDRHPYGIEILQEIMNMPNAKMLLGNHEYMMLNVLNYPYKTDGSKNISTYDELIDLWHYNGGNVTHKAYNMLPEKQKEEIKNFLNSIPLNYDLHIAEKHFKLMHAMPEDYYKKVKAFTHSSATSFCVWERNLQNNLSNLPYISVFGHTPTIYFQNGKTLKIYYNKNMIGIDCGAGFSEPLDYDDFKGRLACLRLDGMTEFYSK